MGIGNVLLTEQRKVLETMAGELTASFKLMKMDLYVTAELIPKKNQKKNKSPDDWIAFRRAKQISTAT